MSRRCTSERIAASPVVCAGIRRAPSAYVVNEGSGSVSIIDTKTDQVSATFNVGERPRGLAVTLAGERVYVSLDDGTIIERDMYAKAESGGTKLGRRTGCDRSQPRRQAARGGDPGPRRDRAARSRDDARREEDTGSRRQGAGERCFQPGRPLDLRHGGAKSRAPRHRRQAGGRDEHDPRGCRACGASRSSRTARARTSRPTRTNEVVVIDVARQAVLARVKTASAPVRRDAASGRQARLRERRRRRKGAGARHRCQPDRRRVRSLQRRIEHAVDSRWTTSCTWPCGPANQVSVSIPRPTGVSRRLRSASSP